MPTTLTSIEIRTATLADAPAIVEVHLRSHLETYPPLVGPQNYWPTGKESRLAQWQAALAGPGIAFVASDGGRIVGFTHALDAKITTLYILAAWHRRGIGRALLARLCQALAARGIATASLAVLTVNAKAIAFYESMGARATGSIVIEEREGSYEDLLFEIDTAAFA
jgi:ribosomal protein S18 acetylase RimI-like enzyme